ncbi:pirin family protein [Psychrobacter celer]|uniref:pirin family protein n=1 Tax=Psychrobacter celer TaxID=306572 RepID=UPI003FD5CF62
MSIKTLEPRLADVGGIPIARLLPNTGKKPIGAWCFLDHAGPAEFEDGDAGMQVGRHPHTNLQTFSWMLDGEVLHKDSLGNEQVITKNQVNVMTAGTGLTQGISHTEQSVFPDTGGSPDAARAEYGAAVDCSTDRPKNRARFSSLSRATDVDGK